MVGSGWKLSPVRKIPAPARPRNPSCAVSTPSTPACLVALANPRHEADLLGWGAIWRLAVSGGEVLGLHLMLVPIQTPLTSARDRFTQQPTIERTIDEQARQAGTQDTTWNGSGERVQPVTATTIEAVTDVTHDIPGGLTTVTVQRQADLLLMGWQGGFNVSRIYNSPVQNVLTHTPADVAVLKNRGLESIQSILIPWGGGPHAQLGLEFAVRIGEATNAEIHLLRITNPGVDVEQERENMAASVESIVGGYGRMHYLVKQSDDDVTASLISALDANNPDLVIIGASHEYRIRNFLFGSIPDVVADHAQCSVLMVRRHLLMRGRP